MAAELSLPLENHPTYRMRTVTTIPFWGVHIAAVAGIIWQGWSWSGLALAVGLYYARMFGITAGYHRYFSHRSYKTGRVMQFLMALLGTLSLQKGVLWWSANHRLHHKFSDQPEDVHSPRQRGFWWSHVGWILSDAHEATHLEQVPDLARYPELRLLNRFHLPIAVAFAVSLFLIAGTWALLWGFFVSTSLLWHGTFTINSFSHIVGGRRYETDDDSRNNWLLALITMGEGWHNNHHYYQRSASQGFFWWEVDMSYYLLTAMSWVGLVWDLQKVPAHVRDPEKARVRRERKLAQRAAAAGEAVADAVADPEQAAA